VSKCLGTTCWARALTVAVVALVAASCGQAKVAEQAFYAQAAGQPVLIAFRSTPFKDAVAKRIVEGMANRNHPVRMIDTEKLVPGCERGCAAVVVMDSVRAGGLSGPVGRFLAGAADKQVIVLVPTSGRGTWAPRDRGIDAITGASRLDRVEDVANAVLERVSRRLGERKG